MGRTRQRNGEAAHPRPVEKVELSEKHVKLRFVLMILLLLVGATAIAYGVYSFFGAEAGWQKIETSASGLNCGDEFVFFYHLGEEEASPAAEKRALTSIYSQATTEAYQLFTNDMEFENVHNVFYINRHPNETIEVEEALYQAFSLLESYEDRSLYLAPVYSRYNNLFDCASDSLAADFDPYTNPEVAEEYAEVAAYANDRAAVDLELLGDQRIRLKVSPEYLAFAEENDMESYIDFYWMKNAFIVDYLAEAVISGGFTRGCISSYDGFIRNLDGSGTAYSLAVSGRIGDVVYPAAVMEYRGPSSIASLRNYPMSDQDSQRYYRMENGEIRTAYLDARDGLCKSARNDLVCYSQELSTAEVLLRMIPLYIADSFSEEGIAALKDEKIYSVYCEGESIVYNDPALAFSNVYQEQDAHYQAVLTK